MEEEFTPYPPAYTIVEVYPEGPAARIAETWGHKNARKLRERFKALKAAGSISRIEVWRDGEVVPEHELQEEK